MNKKIEITCKRFRNMPWRKLKRFQGNLKKINSDSLERLKESIVRHGFAAPMFVWHEHDDILDGHQRIAAIESFVEDGYEVPDKIPVVEIVAATRKRALELVLHYNSQHGKMDEGSLLEYALDSNLEWENLSQIAYDLPEIDYALFERQWNLNKEKMPFIDEDEIPEVTEAITKTGDLWLLGEHRVLCGDATKKEDVERLMDGQKVDMVFTDPPYGQNEPTNRAEHVKTFKKQGIAKKGNYSHIIGDKSTDTAMKSFDILNGLCDTVIYWGGNYFDLKPSPCWIVWDKRVDDNQKDINSDCELAYVKHPHKKSVRIFRHLWKGMIKESERGESRVHPTQKPIALAEWCIVGYGNPLVVLDTFLGSGSTLIACEKTNRKCYGMEIDEHYCDVIVKRWEDYTGKKALID